MRFVHCTWLVLCAVASQLALSMTLDGSLSEAQWQEAIVIDNFSTVIPFSLRQAPYRTEVKLFTNDKGIYVGIINYQPQSLNRIENVQRDGALSGDNNKVIIDFDGNRLSAYAFEVANGGAIKDGIWSQENQFSRDWDGNWEAATRSYHDRWVAEYFIPWDVAPMTLIESETRSIGLFVSRFVAAKGEVYGNSPTNWQRTRFLSDMDGLDVANFSGASFKAFLSATARADLLNKEEFYDPSLDVFWKPDSSKQISLALNPDFGQVESDNLVVNFSPNETFFAEKRPFFTENQSLFDLRGAMGLRLLHTRRIGGPTDTGSGAAAIDGALKMTSNGELTQLGLLAAAEETTAEAQGRDFFAARLSRKLGAHSVGYLVTHADRPDLARSATLQNLDYDFSLGESFKWKGQVLNARVSGLNRLGGAEIDQDDYGAWTQLKHQWSPRFVHFVELTRYGDELEVNDLGYLQRNNIERFRYEAEWERTSSEESALKSRSLWGEMRYAETTEGIEVDKILRVSSGFEFKNTANFYAFAGVSDEVYDDRFTRGNRVLYKSGGHYVGYSFQPKTSKRLRYHHDIEIGDSALQGRYFKFHFHPTINFTDSFSTELNINYSGGREWLVWQQANDIDVFRRRLFDTSVNLNAQMTAKQDLRLKFQWIALSASDGSAFEVGGDGKLEARNRVVEDFSLSRTAIQVRYRYALGPLSNIFLVYSRGASETLQEELNVLGLFSEGWRNRKGDNLLFKIRYLL